MSSAIVSKDFETVVQEVADFKPSREHADGLIAAFGEHIGVEGLQLDENGGTVITIDGDLVVSLSYYAHLAGFVVAAPLPLAAAEDDAIMRDLLRANMSWVHTDGGTFGMASGSNVPMLLRQIPLALLDAEALDKQVADFVDLVRGWQYDIEAGAANRASERAEQAGAAPDPGSMA